MAIGAAHRAKVPKSKVLLPLAYASMLGGMVLLYGTSTNLVASAAFQRSGLAPIGVTSCRRWGCRWRSASGGAAGAAAAAVAEAGGGVADWSLRDYLTEAMLPADSRYLGKELAEITEGLGLRVIGSSGKGRPYPRCPATGRWATSGSSSRATARTSPGEGPAGDRDPPGHAAVGRGAAAQGHAAGGGVGAAGQSAWSAAASRRRSSWSATGWWRWRCTASPPSSG